MVSRIRNLMTKRRERLVQKKLAFSKDAEAVASSNAMKKKTPTHSQMRSPGA